MSQCQMHESNAEVVRTFSNQTDPLQEHPIYQEDCVEVENNSSATFMGGHHSRMHRNDFSKRKEPCHLLHIFHFSDLLDPVKPSLTVGFEVFMFL